MKRLQKDPMIRRKLSGSVGLPFLSLLLVLTLSLVPPARAQDWVEAKWVADGDTILLTDGRHIRYIGVNTPEIEHENQKAEPMGYAARKFNQKLVLGKKLRLEFDREKTDRFSRLLAYVYLRDGTFVNRALLEAGLGHFLYVKPNLLHARTLLDAQRRAMAQKTGIWKIWHERSSKYIGNSNSKRFHAPGCHLGGKIGQKNRVAFSTSWDAFWEGYSPGRRCLSLDKFFR